MTGGWYGGSRRTLRVRLRDDARRLRAHPAGVGEHSALREPTPVDDDDRTIRHRRRWAPGDRAPVRYRPRRGRIEVNGMNFSSALSAVSGNLR